MEKREETGVLKWARNPGESCGWGEGERGVPEPSFEGGNGKLNLEGQSL